MLEITSAGYFWLDTWVFANIIELATRDFCIRFLNRTNDPCGRMFDQMTMAARSAPANIAEGSSRRDTSKETEMRLTDVARATLSELANDYQNWLLQQESIPWSNKSADYAAVNTIQLDPITYRDDVLHQSSIHILAQKHKFDEWLKSNDSLLAANCMLVLCNRLIMMLGRQIESRLFSPAKSAFQPRKVGFSAPQNRLFSPAKPAFQNPVFPASRVPTVPTAFLVLTVPLGCRGAVVFTRKRLRTLSLKKPTPTF